MATSGTTLFVWRREHDVRTTIDAPHPTDVSTVHESTHEGSVEPKLHVRRRHGLGVHIPLFGRTGRRLEAQQQGSVGVVVVIVAVTFALEVARR
jgi:hypothetical protein